MRAGPPVLLRRDLRAPVAPPRWPDDISLLAFDPKRHAGSVYSLLSEAYAKGGSMIAPFESWWAGLRDDAEYDPELVLLAAAGTGMVVGVAHCWTSAFVKDLAVAVSWKRHGIAGALLAHAFIVFRSRGARHVDLKAEADNDDALRLYRRNSMGPAPPPQP